MSHTTVANWACKARTKLGVANCLIVHGRGWHESGRNTGASAGVRE